VLYRTWPAVFTSPAFRAFAALFSGVGPQDEGGVEPDDGFGFGILDD
jgi:hypothetical protein